MKALNLFLHLDIYGKIPSFTIHGHSRFRTIIGALLSLLTYMIIILFFVVYLNGVLMHFSPKLITTVYNDFDPLPVYLSNKNFILTLSLQTSDYSNYINESIYYLNASLSSTILMDDGNYKEQITPIEIIKCSNYNFQFLHDYWKNLPLSGLYCLNSNNIELRGAFKTPKWNVLYIKFSKCVNSTKNNNTCQTEEIIDNYLKGGYLGIFMSDYIIEPNNFKKPSQFYGKNLFTTFTYKEYADYWIYLKDEQVITDIGYFFENKNTEFYFAVDEISHLTDYREDNVFLSVGVRKSLKREVYERGYIKIQEASANACGIIKVATVCGEIISYFFQKLLYDNFIIQFIIFSKEYERNKLNYNMNNSNQLFKSLYGLNNEKNYMKNKSFNQQTYSLNKRKSNHKLILNYNINNNIIKNHCNNYNANNNSSFLSTPNKNIYSSNHSRIYNSRRFIKKPFTAGNKIFFSQILCHKHCIKKVKFIFNKFSKIKYCFDIIQYLKLQYEIGLIKNYVFDEEKNQIIKDLYLFDYDEFTEKEGYDKVFLSLKEKIK